MSDRSVHGKTVTGAEVVRYDRAGKWYVEPLAGNRQRLSVQEAVDLVTMEGAEWYPSRQGGQQFDAKVRKRKGSQR